MNRRAFLRTLTSGLAATAALGAVDPEALLWTPGAKTIILPPVSGWSRGSGNVFVTPQWIVRDMVQTLEAQLKISQAMDIAFARGDQWSAKDYSERRADGRAMLARVAPMRRLVHG